MKSIVLSGVAALLVVSAANVARAQTALQPGLWEVSEKTTMEGVQPMPATSRQEARSRNSNSTQTRMHSGIADCSRMAFSAVVECTPV